MSIYDDVTARIVAELEKGAAPWVKPWRVDSTAEKNFFTQKPYQGVNRLLVGMSSMSQGFSNPAWATFKQWQAAGINVKKGEKGTQIVFFKPVSKETVNDSGETKKSGYCVARAYCIFNAEQTDAVIVPAEKPETVPFNANEQCEQRIVKTGASISHGGDSAFYMPSQDRIQLPHKSSFDCEASYYATALHELTHWSGAKHRLDRQLDKGRFGNPAYAFEELVAEMGAAFLCQDYGIQGELRHAGYIGHWLKACREDNRAIFKAAALAQKAADYINGLDATAEQVAA
jgi:antirestriction protein ArdC